MGFLANFIRFPAV